MVRDGLVFKDEDGQVIFNQYSFCELVKHLLVELVGISYEEASQTVERAPLAEPVADAVGVAIFSHDRPYYWAMFFYYGNGYWWEKGIPAQPTSLSGMHLFGREHRETNSKPRLCSRRTGAGDYDLPEPSSAAGYSAD